jgi:hypothetical protein
MSRRAEPVESAGAVGVGLALLWECAYWGGLSQRPVRAVLVDTLMLCQRSVNARTGVLDGVGDVAQEAGGGAAIADAVVEDE